MKIFWIVFGILCVSLVSNCEDRHHIKERVLDNKAETDSEETNIPDNPVIFNDTKSSQPYENSSTASASRDSSEELEQKLDSLRAPENTLNNSIKNAETLQQADLPQAKGNETLDDLKVFPGNISVSSLLRTNNVSSTSADVKNPVFIGVVSNISTNEIQAPKIFPNGTSVNGIIIIDSDKLQTLISPKNGTIEEAKKATTNANINNNQTGVDTEVKDLLISNVQETVAQHPLDPLESAQIPDKFNDETELIENGENTEDQLRKHDHKDWVDTDQRYLAAISVCSLVAVSVLCYAALLVWRRYLENRYGSRTMLVNEDEFDDPSDLRHFSEEDKQPC